MPRTSPASILLHLLLTAWMGMAIGSAAPREHFQDQNDLGPKKTEDSVVMRVRKTRSMGDSSYESQDGPSRFLYMRSSPPAKTEVRLRDSLVLECEAGGSPPPTIHWLKDGVKVRQEDYSNAIPDALDIVEPQLHGIGSTKSRLEVDCFSAKHQGSYTCVADTPFQRRTAVSNVFLADAVSESATSCTPSPFAIGSPGQVPRVYMWTAHLLQTIGKEVVLFCRGAGDPYPKVTWSINDGDLLRNSNKYHTMDNGDLRIRRINWNDMGEYRCESENKFGKDSVTTFLYPMAPEDK